MSPAEIADLLRASFWPLLGLAIWHFLVRISKPALQQNPIATFPTPPPFQSPFVVSQPKTPDDYVADPPAKPTLPDPE